MSPWQCREERTHPGQLQWKQMFGSKRRCNDQESKHGTQRSISQCVPKHNLPFFHVNIRKVNTGRNPHACWLSHTHVKCIIKSVSIINVYSVPDAKITILYQSGQTRVIFAFLAFQSLSPLPPPLQFRFNFILSAFLVVAALISFLTETKRVASVVGLEIQQHFSVWLVVHLV